MLSGEAAVTPAASNCTVKVPESYFRTPSVATPNLRVPVAVTPVEFVGIDEQKNVAGAVVVEAVGVQIKRYPPLVPAAKTESIRPVVPPRAEMSAAYWPLP